MKIKVLLLVNLLMVLLIFTQCNRKSNPVKGKPSSQNKITKKEVTTPAAKKTENFDVFYKKFHTDSLFQLSRVQFPLKGQQIHLKGTNSWKKDNWMMIKATAAEIDRAEYNVKTVRKVDSYFEGIYCKNCGFSFEMEYRLINGKWYLIYLQERDQ